MSRRARILIVGQTPFAKTIAAALRTKFEVTASPRVSIELFLQRARPDLAVLESQSVDALAEIDALLRLADSLPIVLVGARPMPRHVARAAHVVVHPEQVRPYLPALAKLILDRRGMSARAGNDAVALGIVPATIEAGQSVAYLWHAEGDLANLVRFWTVADDADEFLLIGSKSATQVIRRAFGAAGLGFDGLVRSRRLTVITAGDLNLPLLQRVLRHVQAVTARHIGTLRIIVAAAGWTEKKQRRNEHLLCERLWTGMLAELPAVSVCPYRAARFSAPGLVSQLLETHPWVISHDELLRNPFVRS